MGKHEEPAVELDDTNQHVKELEANPVDMVERLRMICRWFLVIFLVRHCIHGVPHLFSEIL